MQFSRILDALHRRDDVWTVDVPESWLQGRTLFGGLQAGLAVRAMRSLLPEPLPLRVLQVTFIAPVPAGPVTVQARVLRTGRSATHVEGRLLSGESTAALVVGIFGSSRESQVRVAPVQSPITPESDLVLPHVPGVSPAFTRHFRMQWLRGGLPFTRTAARELVLGVSLHDDGPTVIEHALAIADAPPPVALSHLETRSFGSSMTWNLEMLRDTVTDLPLSGYRVDAELVAGAHGYTSQSVMVWSPAGEPVALSRQSMVVFG